MTMGYVFFTILFLFVSGVISQTLPEYDFEGSVPIEITPKASLSISNDQFKNGDKSLKWDWTASQQITWDLSSHLVGLERNAGIKIWLYLATKLPGKCLSVCVREKTSNMVSCFLMSLNFTGWRAAWVAFKEFIGCPITSTSTADRNSMQNSLSGNKKIDQLYLKAPATASAENPLFIDLLRFDKKISKASRDSIVPPITYDNNTPQAKCISCADMLTMTEEMALEQFRRKASWQQAYRWSLKDPLSDQESAVDDTKLNGIKEISNRLVNWYANERKAYTRIPYALSHSDPFSHQRWDKLLKNFDSANQKTADFITSTGNAVVGLFARNSKYGKTVNGGRKFSELFSNVLHPRTLEYVLKSRSAEVEHTACEFAKQYPCGTQNFQNRDIRAITGRNSTAITEFTNHVRSAPLSCSSAMHPSCPSVTQACFDHVKQAINNLNKDRKAKVLQLFSYIKDQGWQHGSCLGSLDEELLGMSGFAHSVFLMRNELKAAGKLDDLIAVMKWFMEFGEVYQEDFEFRGSTADRIRTAMFFRLMTVLIMPEDNDRQKREKLRDMEALKGWIKNALSVNEGLAGLIKPDFTCYHHRFFYASAYCPSALHTAALITYLLDETPFELDAGEREALTNALKVYRIAAVNYSTPGGIGGRNPTYNQAILAEHVPSYAYMAMKSLKQDFLTGHPNLPNLNVDLGEVRMFLRLYKHTTTGGNTCDGKLNEHLCKGGIQEIYYLNTLGALDIMDRVKTLSSTVTTGHRKWYYKAEESPSGHWSKQFASLSIHRREDWVVSVKGFDKSVVDFEKSLNPVGNLYGMYSSHGAMLIANSEEALDTKDVDNGWDWRKIPGTTVIHTTYPQMKIDSSHHYNPADDAMAGGVSLTGSQTRKKGNGVFGMSFEMPRYDNLASNSPFQTRNFRFKKSVFFYDDVIISLGSNIQYSSSTNEVHTTLFQDLQPTNPSSSTSQLNVYRCNDGTPLVKDSWEPGVQPVILVDVNGNRFYIPDPRQQGLVFHRNQNQNSFKHDKETPVATNGKYCTAWLNHGKTPSRQKAEYEYVVQVAAEPVGGQAKSLLDLENTYSVLLKNRNVHVVKFPAARGKRGTVYGYVVFPSNIDPSSPISLGSEGPLTSVLHQSVIMTEEETNPTRLHISVSSAQLNLQQIPGSPSWCPNTPTTPDSSKDVDENLLFCAKSAKQDIHVNLREPGKWRTIEKLYVGGKLKTSVKDLYLSPTSTPRQNPYKFTNLRNGADTEVTFSDS